jgi:hypothetical protein
VRVSSVAPELLVRLTPPLRRVRLDREADVARLLLGMGALLLSLAGERLQPRRDGLLGLADQVGRLLARVGADLLGRGLGGLEDPGDTGADVGVAARIRRRGGGPVDADDTFGAVLHVSLGHGSVRPADGFLELLAAHLRAPADPELLRPFLQLVGGRAAVRPGGGDARRLAAA